MHVELHNFLSRWLGVVAMTLLPVVLTAFVSMPLSLNRHPGEPVSQQPSLPRHMT
jgi:hypothetical protein